jgi:hypothetical protein
MAVRQDRRMCAATPRGGAMMSLRGKYALLKGITVALGALSIPWSTFVGFSFGVGHYSIAVVGLCIQTVVALVDGYIWFWVLEHMNADDKKSTRPIQIESTTS